jgi:hypothetical protein
MKSVFGKEDKARALYRDIMRKKRTKTIKKIPETKPQATKTPYITSKPIQDVMAEVK